MNAVKVDTKRSGDQSHETRQDLLKLAKQLDRFGHNVEEFLCGQLAQLQRSIAEFEQEKAAWRRQIRRESQQLSRERQELDRLREQNDVGTSAALPDPRIQRRKAADEASRKGGTNPVRLLLQPSAASPMQVSLLFFEISMLNREMGGPGLQFEVADVRLPRKRMLTRNPDPDCCTQIYEFHGFPSVPLTARGSHVSLDVDNTERVADWISFKSQLLQSALADGDLAALCRKATPVKRSAETRSFILEATRRPDPERLKELEPSGGSSALLLGRPLGDAVRQQVLRLEVCFEKLSSDTGLRAQIGP